VEGIVSPIASSAFTVINASEKTSELTPGSISSPSWLSCELIPKRHRCFALQHSFSQCSGACVSKDELSHSSHRRQDRPAPAMRRSAAYPSALPILGCSATPAALEMPRLYHRSVATLGHTLPFHHRRCLPPVLMTLPPVRMRLSQKASHPRAGGIAHRSARSQEFAGGARTPEEINAHAFVCWSRSLPRSLQTQKRPRPWDDRS
jgi:hypothetical protein